jgi:glycine cleavage system H protein
MVPKDLRYTDQHEWIRMEGKVGTVGITDFAQRQLGDVTFVELPDVGKALHQGGEACSIESAKAASSIYAPASGNVTAVNEALAADPSLVNTDPFGRGWVYKIELTDAAQINSLLSPQQYEELTKE